MTAISWINGVPCSSIALDDRGLAYGDGLFETLLVIAGKPILLERHLLRLSQGCARLNIQLDSGLLVKEVSALLSACDDNAQHVLKIMITRTSGSRGYRYAGGMGSQRVLMLMPLVSTAPNFVQVRLCRTPLAINPVLAGMKHLCRLENVLARAEWQDDSIFEGLMLDTEGYVVEGVSSNVFMVQNGLLYTPHLDRCGVAGVLRGYILEVLAPELSLPVSLDRLLPEQFADADELFICNSIIGIVPVIKYANFQKPFGVMTRQLQLGYQQVLNNYA